MMFGMCFGMLGSGECSNRGMSTNVCLQNIGTDGTYWLYDSNTVGMGDSDPAQTISGVFFYAFKCDAAGNFIIQWGDAGDEQLTDVSSILVYNKGQTDADVATWNDVTNRYEFVNTDWATRVIAEYNAGVREVCYSMKILPSPFIHYTFSEILKGGAPYVPPTKEGAVWTFTTAQASNVYIFKSAEGEGLWINDVFYFGNGDIEIEVVIEESGTVTIQESKVNVLTYIKFYDCGLTGPIPYFNNNIKLTYLYLATNQLTGMFPNISELIDIDYINLEVNQLTGELPDILPNQKLRVLFCGKNQFTGSILDISGNLNLEVCSLFENQLTGNIPDLSINVNLLAYGVAMNQLTGNIPDLSTLINLEGFGAFESQLTGFDGGDIFVSSSFYQQDNNFNETTIDSLLSSLVSGGTTGSAVAIDLSGTNAAPSAAGLADRDILVGRGCTVTVST